MPVEPVLFIEGILKIANIFLAIVAIGIAMSLFAVSGKYRHLKPWRVLIVALVLFSIQQIFGALRAFQIYENPYITHVIPTVILVLLIRAVILQQELNLTK